MKMVLEAVGHDGSDIVWPDLPEPVRRRSFHIEELQYAAYYFGYHLVPFVAAVEHEPVPDSLSHIVDLRGKFQIALHKYDGVLLGNYVGSPNRHAVAWNAKEKLIYDPSGRITDIDGFSIWCFYATIRSR